MILDIGGLAFFSSLTGLAPTVETLLDDLLLAGLN
jgi:hypothetical protein